MVLSKVIKEHIIRNGENKIYTVSDFADLNNDIPVSEQEQVWNLQAEH